MPQIAKHSCGRNCLSRSKEESSTKPLQTLKTHPMTLPEQIAKHFREVHLGGNWTFSNLKEHLEGVTWQQATAQVDGFNSIAALVYHIHYYVHAALDVLEGKPLNAKDTYSFDYPTIDCRKDWEILLNKTRTDAEKFANLVSLLPESKLWETFSEEKYGNYYRNLHGIIEHAHYHLGQIVLLKKLLLRIGEE